MVRKELTEQAYMQRYSCAFKEADWLDLKSGSKPVARDSQSTEILFLEQCCNYLAEGGYLAIVIPDGILTNSSLQYVRDWIEAHRTTGVTLAGQDESAFTKVHDPDFLKAKRRLYMTATPRLYADEAKSRAAQAVLCSMDEASLYGPEIYRIGFGEAVDFRACWQDYKVLIFDFHPQRSGHFLPCSGGRQENRLCQQMPFSYRLAIFI